MPLDFRSFRSAFTSWLQQQPPIYTEYFPASSYRKLHRLGEDTAQGGTVFIPDKILRTFFNGDKSQRDVANAVAEYLSGLSVQPTNTTTAESHSETVDVGSSTQAPPRTTPSASGKPEAQAQWRFPSYDYSEPSVEDWGGVKVSHFADKDSGDVLEYRWQECTEDTVYRVVTSDMEEPYNPDDFDSSRTVEQARFIDADAPTSPYRFITIWAYPKDPVNKATVRQGRLVSKTLYVHPLREWTMSYMDGALMAQWPQVSRGTGAAVDVSVARLPEGQPPGRFLRDLSWLTFQLPSDGTGFLKGFQDEDVEEGQTYSYVAAVRVLVDGQERYSTATHQRYTVAASAPKRVTDLQVQMSGAQQDRWKLEWTNPVTGEVSFFRTMAPPDAGAIDRAEIPYESLAAAGLTEAFKLKNPQRPVLDANRQAVPRRWFMDPVSWPEGDEWDSVYLTPVTEVGDRYAIGTPTVQQRARRVAGVTVVQRMSWQLVTFEWPGNALSVNLQRTRRHEDFQPDSPPEATIEKDEYERSGGFALKASLPAEGARIHLTSSSYYGGKAVTSPPTSVDVPPLWGYSYILNWPNLTLPGRRRVITINIAAIRGSCPPSLLPSLVLVYNENRLPLSAQDGDLVPMHAEKPGSEIVEDLWSIQAPSTGDLTVYFDSRGTGGRTYAGGYFRLMVNAPSEEGESSDIETSLERYALVDPSLQYLRNR